MSGISTARENYTGHTPGELHLLENHVIIIIKIVIITSFL